MTITKNQGHKRIELKGIILTSEPVAKRLFGKSHILNRQLKILAGDIWPIDIGVQFVKIEDDQFKSKWHWKYLELAGTAYKWIDISRDLTLKNFTKPGNMAQFHICTS